MKNLKWIFILPFAGLVTSIILLCMLPKIFYEVMRDHRKALREGKTVNPYWFKEIPYKHPDNEENP